MTEQIANAGGMHLSFFLEKGLFAVDILRVREIIAMHEITSLPGMPTEIKGVINLRGKIIPVLDLRIKLGLSAADFDRFTCIVVVDMETEDGSIAHVGCIVDSVREVAHLSLEEIQSPPRVNGGQSDDFILGLYKPESHAQVMTILDVQGVLKSLMQEHGEAVETLVGV